MHDVLIIGGGLAGSAAGVLAARGGASVLLLEQRRYPAHKLCGEFLSGEVLGLFERLGVLGAVRSAGARVVETARLTAPSGRTFEAPLPGAALALTRYRLDPLLAAQARAEGADVREGVTVRGIEGDLREGFAVETDDATYRARVVFGAYGRRSRLDRRLERPFLERTTPRVAFKAHYAGPSLPGAVEVHAFPDGYCGLVEVEDGAVNACWITHERALQAAGGDPEEMVRTSFARNPVLAERFDGAERTSERFLAVSQVSFARKGTFERDVCMIGDAAGMIAPLCGDGMAMALRAAHLAVPPALDFLQGRSEASAFREAYARAWTREFGLRLRLGRMLHAAGTRPVAAEAAVAACRLAPGLGRWLIEKTRG